MLKRILDLVVASVLLVLLLPLMLILAVAVKLDSPGPVFYRARRVARSGQEFAMLKFRKMGNGPDGPPVTTRNDARFTRVGRWLARTKLDELPQLLNVLKGDMSLVGPRPEDPRFVRLRLSDYAAILHVRPGITGLAQLAFARESDILDSEHGMDDYVQNIFPQKIALDSFYAGHRSVGMDVKILAWTAVAVIMRRDVAVQRGNGALGVRRRPQARQDVSSAHQEVSIEPQRAEVEA